MVQGRLNVLIVDDDESIRDMLSIVLKDENYNVLTAEDGEKALVHLKKSKINLVISDIKMPDMDGIELLNVIKKKNEKIPVIMITGHASTNDAIEAMKIGAEQYITKPFNIDELKVVIEKAIYRKKIEEENIELKSKIGSWTEYEKIIGKSKHMLEIFVLIESMAENDSTVLISGESGTGKELIAKAIHNRSCRTDEKFISINCSALPEALLESELFGHKKGSFTDAYADKKGLFEEADNGTLFLDEIAEMSLQMQVKLLRAIQEKKIKPIGSNEEISINSRIISATNKNLKDSIEDGSFRSDLYYRLNVIPIVLPPLRERKEDILLLLNHFIEMYNKKFSKEIKGVEKSALLFFENYSWPGNIRELSNFIERAMTLEKSNYITISSVPVDETFSDVTETDTGHIFDKLLANEKFNFNEYIDDISKEILLKALSLKEFNLKKTADMLMLSYRSLRYLIDKYNLKIR